MKIKLLLASTLCTVLLGGYLFLQKPAPSVSPNTLIIGTASNYAPWVSTNEQGQLEGFDIDVIKAVATTMGRELIIQDLGSMTSLLMALDQKKIDALIWGMSITEDRLKQMAMVRYQGETVTAYPLLFWKKIPKSIASITDMKGKTIAVEPASSQDTVLDLYPFITKMSLEKVDDALLALQYGKADAALVEPAIAQKYKKKYSEIKTIDVPLLAQNQVKGVGICIKPENTQLITEVQNAVTTLEKKGIIKTLEAQWGIE